MGELSQMRDDLDGDCSGDRERKWYWSLTINNSIEIKSDLIHLI